MAARLATLSWGWLLGVFGAEVASFACTFALQRLLLRTDKWFAVAAAGLSGNAVTNVLPGGDAAGAAVQFGMLATAGINPDVAAAGLTAASLLGIGGLLALPVFTLPAMLGGAPVSPGLLHTALLGLGGFVLFVVCGIAVVATDRPLALVGRIAQGLWNRLPGRHAKVTGLDRRLLVQRNDIRSTLGRNWPKAVLLIGGRLGMDYLLPARSIAGHGQRPPTIVGAAGLLGHRHHRLGADYPGRPGGRRGQLERAAGPGRGQWRPGGRGHLGLSLGLVLASVAGRRRRLFSVPATLRANTPGRPKAPVEPMSTGKGDVVVQA